MGITEFAFSVCGGAQASARDLHVELYDISFSSVVRVLEGLFRFLVGVCVRWHRIAGELSWCCGYERWHRIAGELSSCRGIVISGRSERAMAQDSW